MPEMSGFAAGSEIRRRSDTPMIFLTAYAGESDKYLGFSAGADDYIVKPFSNTELLMRVKAILRRTMGKADSSVAKDGSDMKTKMCIRDRPYGEEGEQTISIAIVSGLRNAENLIRKIESGEVHYDFVEVMACQGGCIAGAGQPFVVGRARAERSQGMYEADQLSNVRTSQGNPVTENLYNGLLAGENAHRLLHYK